jgi:uroporphyrinogen III methyltransferase/synthase
MRKTQVYLIGAGAGDPELITQKACRALQLVDVVLYDYLVHPNIVMMATRAQKICVGKKKGAHSTQQPNINALLVSHAKKGHIVARLKGGDPMIFGRCGEEMAVLFSEGIPYEIIPGITSAISAPTYAGIPITHRDCSHSVAFVTATRANDIETIAFPNADTLVMMMSLLRLPSIIARLAEVRPLDTPVAIIESGTYASEKVVTGTLETIVALQESAQLKPPALIVVGKVVDLRSQCRWRNHLPLRHQRFVIFRPPHQQSALVDGLSLWGAEVVTLSLNHIVPAPDCLAPVDLTAITWLVFTSDNGVRAFFSGLLNKQCDIRSCKNARILAIGPKTKAALMAHGVTPDLMPEVATSDGVIATLKQTLSTRDHVLIPTSSEADDALLDLRTTGATVTKIVGYANHAPNDIQVMLDWIKQSDTMIFMNAASVKRLHAHYPKMSEHLAISIGPKTTAELQRCGVDQVLESKEASINGVIDIALAHEWAGTKPNGHDKVGA